MDRPGGYYSKRNKSDGENQIPYDFTCMWNRKNKNKQTNKINQKQTHRYKEQTGGFQRAGDGGGTDKIGERH